MVRYRRNLTTRSMTALSMSACFMLAACEQTVSAPETYTLAFSQVVSTSDFELFGTTAATSQLNPSTLLLLDPATGGQTLAGPSGLATNSAALAWNPGTTTLFGSARSFGPNPGVIHEIDPATGIAVPVATIRQAGVPLEIGTLAFTSDGTMWGTAGQMLGVIDLNSQTFAPRLALPAGSFPNAIDVAPSGLMYVVLQEFPVSRLVLVTIDLSAPAIVDQRHLNSQFAVDDIAFAPDGFIYHTNFSHALIRIDPVTATATLVGFGSVGGLGGLAAAPRDIDDDGVPNSIDLCPGTPAGAVVDADGCTSQQRIQQLAAQVAAMLAGGTLGRSQASGLTAKLTAALISVNDGRTKAACGQLTAFINQVAALMRTGAISSSQEGSALQKGASATRMLIGC